MNLLLLLSQQALAVNYEIKGGFFAHEEAFDPTVLYYTIGGILLLTVLFKIRSFLRTITLRKELRHYHKKKAEAKMSAMNVSDVTAQGLDKLAAFADVEPDQLLADNILFEKAASEYAKKHSESDLIKKFRHMREELDFVFINPKAKFLNTNMMEKGQKLRVYLEAHGESRPFLSQVLRSSEKQLWVSPPKIKNKTINLSKLRRVRIRVYRNGDGEYEFIMPLRAQIRKPISALILDQVSQLQPLDAAPMEKVRVNYQNKFVFLVPLDQDDPFLTKYTSMPVQGTLTSLSTNQIRMVSTSLPDLVVLGTYLLFKFKEAGINERIKGRVVKVDQDAKYYYTNIQIVEMSEKGRLQLENFMHTHQRTPKAKPKPPVAPKI